MPVGDIDIRDDDWKDAVYPHIFGGIPVHVDGVVTNNVYKMKRNDQGTFLSIDGLVE